MNIHSSCAVLALRSYYSNMAIAVFITLVLGGCSGKDMSDLDAFIAEVKNRPPTGVEPLPEIRPYESFLYSAGDLRDPFEPIVEAKPEPPPAPEQEPSKPISTIHPDFHRNRETLEAYPLDTLRMVGTLEQRGERWGLVRGPGGTIYRVQVGNFMGQNHGHITQISEDHIALTEIITDGGDGWQERQAALGLSELK